MAAQNSGINSLARAASAAIVSGVSSAGSRIAQ
jgi:hypothetical protein